MAPFLLYGPYFCTENQFNLPGEKLIPDGADAGLPHWTVSEQFYTRVFDYVKKKGGIGYEVLTPDKKFRISAQNWLIPG
eukprot:SAG31_NODE_243_length_19342_cov_12.906459_13_plen_79_part_00